MRKELYMSVVILSKISKKEKDKVRRTLDSKIRM